MKMFLLCLSLLPLTVSAVSLRVDPDSDQFFRDETIVLSCEGQRDVWTVKRTTEGHTQVQSCGRGQDFGNIQHSSCVLEFPVPSDSGSYWCESGSGARGPQRPLSVTGGHLILESPGLPVEAGSDVTLRCRTRPGSKLNPEIQKDGSVIQSRSEWTITDVSKLHEGRYSCSALEEGAAVRSAERELRVKEPPSPSSSLSPPGSSSLSPPGSSSLSPPGPVMISVVSAVVLVLVLVVLRCGQQTDQETTVNSGGSRAETEMYENLRPDCEPADSTYQSLSVDTMDPNQTYSSIRELRQTHVTVD